ncbi:hypothetical protein GUJ93_ZPchr0002g26226 [Zizania palustris]|uniref:Uncharacterized protein n=1 Tax=Zizania palustris TaxID=103762 RepID=A0A8J5VGJ8_ZIZPA|nr:hypothetical protein GUJ93_ZPchr0002g26226 [Zizania palustris]
MEHLSFLPLPPSVACSSFAQKLVLLLLSLIRLTTLATSSLSSKTRSCLISSDNSLPPPLPAAIISRWKYCARIAHGLPAPSVDAQLDPSVDDEYSVDDASEQQDDGSSSPPRTTDGSVDDEADVRWDSRSRRQGAQTPAPCRCRWCRRHLDPSFPRPFFLPIAIISPGRVD